MHSSWLLAPVCRAFGAVGAFVALATGFLTCASVLMRAVWSAPIPGDVEMTQMGIAFAISMCLPYCQLQKANIIVDFFTQSTSAGTRKILDAIGSLMLVLLYGLLAWRSSVGAFSVREAGETTMIIGLPMWWAYACLAPGLALAGWVALVQIFQGQGPSNEEVSA
ncbi:MAG: putative small permease component [Pseudomonadota bacterium]|jgi:TRAP-type C4-dicarboxylate transport system permease small subunit